MIQFIKDNRPYSQTDRQDRIEHYLSIGCVEVPILYNENFLSPFWNGTEFIETATQEEIDAPLILFYEDKIIENYKYLMLRALSSSMGKKGDYEYLNIQKDEYKEKYKTAKRIEVNPVIEDVIQKEMLRDFDEPTLDYILNMYGITPDGTQLDKMNQLIVFRYEYANNRYNIFKGYIIDFRTKCRTLVELKQWVKLDAAFALVDALPYELTDEQAQEFYNDFQNI